MHQRLCAAAAGSAVVAFAAGVTGCRCRRVLSGLGRLSCLTGPLAQAASTRLQRELQRGSVDVQVRLWYSTVLNCAHSTLCLNAAKQQIIQKYTQNTNPFITPLFTAQPAFQGSCCESPALLLLLLLLLVMHCDCSPPAMACGG
jgi:hypothetical protein